MFFVLFLWLILIFLAIDLISAQFSGMKHVILSIGYISFNHIKFFVFFTDVSESRCHDIDIQCQDWYERGYCATHDFIRYFCPISCRNPICHQFFATYATKTVDNKWFELSSTTCDYSSHFLTNRINTNKDSNNHHDHNHNNNNKHNLSGFKLNKLFSVFDEIDLKQCQNICENNPFCTNILYLQSPKRQFGHSTINLNELFILQYDININININIDVENHINPDSETICIQSYLPPNSCNPVCMDILPIKTENKENKDNIDIGDNINSRVTYFSIDDDMVTSRLESLISFENDPFISSDVNIENKARQKLLVPFLFNDKWNFVNQFSLHFTSNALRKDNQNFFKRLEIGKKNKNSNTNIKKLDYLFDSWKILNSYNNPRNITRPIQHGMTCFCCLCNEIVFCILCFFFVLEFFRMVLLTCSVQSCSTSCPKSPLIF